MGRDSWLSLLPVMSDGVSHSAAELAPTLAISSTLRYGKIMTVVPIAIVCVIPASHPKVLRGS